MAIKFRVVCFTKIFGNKCELETDNKQLAETVRNNLAHDFPFDTFEVITAGEADPELKPTISTEIKKETADATPT
jgi:hypothetical protein